MADAEDRHSLLSIKSVKPSPDTITKLVRRIRALTLTLLPEEVSLECLKEPSSRVITPKVIQAYVAAAGDFREALPFALLRARKTFMRDAEYNMADYDENIGRAITCEVLARRIVHLMEPERLTSIMSTRFRYREPDGEESNVASALEYAIDQECTIFLSSSEAQDVVNALWRGDWVQKINADSDIDYVTYDETRETSTWGRFDPWRLSVPRYQNAFRIMVWLFFLFVYSQAVRQPLAPQNPRHEDLDKWEITLYVMALSFSIEESVKLFKTIRLFTFLNAFGFWTIMSILTDALLLSAFVLRLIGLATPDSTQNFHMKSFQVLSCVAPLIWMRLVTVFDGVKYVGTMQICLGRMLQESTIFFAILSVLLAGFMQGMAALDASDGQFDQEGAVIQSLIQALLQAPDFEKPGSNTFGLILYYFWNFANTVILLNILVSLFSSAYDDVVDDAEAQYMAFFAGKTVGLIRAPDIYVYVPPFNLLEIIFIAPWEYVLDSKLYAKVNRVIMSVLFCVPVASVALFESYIEGTSKHSYLRNWFNYKESDDDQSADAQDPEVDDADGLQISKVPFKELTKVFPNPHWNTEERIVHEIKELKQKMDTLMEKLDAKAS